MTVEQIYKLEMAEQQLTGFAAGKDHGRIKVLAEEMGLKKPEWKSIKKRFPDLLSKIDTEELDEYFKN